MSLKDKINLAFGLINGEYNYAEPAYINLDITRRCNMACPGCQFHFTNRAGAIPGDPQVKDISMDLVKQIASEIPLLGIKQVIIAGDGEPLLHPEFCEIIKILKSTGCLVQVFTNGALIEKIGDDALIKSGLDRLYVSLWADNKENYQKIYQLNDSTMFLKVEENISVLNQNKKEKKANHLEVTLTGPITQFNYQNLEQRIEQAHRLGCDRVSFSLFRTPDGTLKEYALLPEHIQFIVQNQKHLRKFAREVGIRHNLNELILRYKLGKESWKRYPCYASWFHAAIRVDGVVTVCGWCPFVLGDLNSESLESIWNGEKIRQFRRSAWNSGKWLDLEPNSACDWCCFIRDIDRLHRSFGWLPAIFHQRG